jgi:hypothetical protein
MADAARRPIVVRVSLGENGMFYLLLVLGLMSMAAGLFIVGFAVPIRETTFGSALLVVGSIAITGGLITVGLAAAVAELRRVIAALKARMPAVPRPLRPVERKDGSDKRPGPPRMPLSARPSGDLPQPVPPMPHSPEPPPAAALPEMEPHGAARKPGPEWLRRAIAEIESTPKPADPAPAGPNYYREDVRPMPEAWPRVNAPAPGPFAPAPNQDAPQPRQAPAAAPHNIFDMVWPSDRHRGAGEGGPPEQRAELPPEPSMRPPEPRPAPSAPPPTASMPARAEQRPLSILKSGVIDEMAYTLFTDGSIEASMPDGTMRFASIEELREHLENHEG